MSDSRRPMKTATVIFRDEAIYCGSNKCYRFQRSSTLSEKTAIYLSDEGDRLTTNRLALELAGSVSIEMAAGKSVVIEASGECTEVPAQKMIDYLNQGSREPSSRPKR